MSIYTEAREKITGMNNDQWQGCSQKVQSNSEYGPAQTGKNLQIILKELDIDLPDTLETLDEMLQSRDFDRFPANKLYALVTVQKRWFDNLQKGIDDPGVPPEPDQFEKVRNTVRANLTHVVN